MAFLVLMREMENIQDQINEMNHTAQLENQNIKTMQRQLDDTSKSLQKGLDELQKVDKLIEKIEKISTFESGLASSDKCEKPTTPSTKIHNSNNAVKKEIPTENAEKISAKAKDASKNLFPAAQCGDAVEVKRLLRNGADANARDENGNTVLQVATFAGGVDVVIALLDAGVNVNEESTNFAVPLLIACSLGHVEIVRILLAAGANIASLNIEWHTALDIAAKKKHWEVVKLLIRNGAQRYRYRDDVILIAATCGQAEVVRDLLPTINVKKKDILLWMCLSVAGNVSVVQAIEEVFPGSVRSEIGENAMLRAADRGHTAALAALLDAGVDINFCDSNGSALGYACFSGRLECAKLLINRGAMLNIRDKNGFTPLHNAASQGNESCVRLLLNAGADRGIKNNEGRTPHDVSKTDAVKHRFTLFLPFASLSLLSLLLIINICIIVLWPK